MSVTPPTIQQGSTGDAVRQAQFLLSTEGLEIPPAGIDGVFGPQTSAAVKSFQKEFSLSVDGIVGQNTWAKLFEMSGHSQPIPPTLQQGSTGSLVERMQSALNTAKSLFAPTVAPLVLDGDFGPLTVAMVESLQRFADLAVDGIVGLQTWAVSLDVFGQSLWAATGP